MTTIHNTITFTIPPFSTRRSGGKSDLAFAREGNVVFLCLLVGGMASRFDAL